ncbi:MAG: hypothetical protein FWE24_05495 [Defluviitaleaceae bacterium]|nr:hypothetical protein [Defluviitaleaceae bacterium]
MNIIRTAAVELSEIPAIAYKQKLKSGGAGVKLIRLDCESSAVATIDKRSGEPVAYGNIDENLFPYEAFEEAIELTVGLPFSARGKISLNVSCDAEDEDLVEEDVVKTDMTLSDEYLAIVERYRDEKGKMNYLLMNKDFMSFASKSKVVSEMVGKMELNDDILLHIIKNRASHIAGKKESLEDNEVKALIEVLDEIDPRSAFKELKAYINRLLSAASGKGSSKRR